MLPVGQPGPAGPVVPVAPSLSLVPAVPVVNTIRYAVFRSRSHRAVIRAYDEADNVIETHESAGDFKEPSCSSIAK